MSTSIATKALPEAALRYQAACDTSTLVLSLPATEGSASAAVAAAGLAEVDALLGELDRWLGSTLDWQWIPDGMKPAPCTEGIDLHWPLAQGQDRLATLTLPSAPLRKAGMPPVGLQTVASSPVMPWRLLDRFELEDEDAAGLAPGAAVLIAPHGHGGWLALPADGASDASPLAVLPLPSGKALAPPAAALSPPPRGRWSLRQALTRPCPLAIALGWQPCVEMPLLDPRVELWEDTTLRAWGELLPLGATLALRLQALATERHDTAASWT